MREDTISDTLPAHLLAIFKNGGIAEPAEMTGKSRFLFRPFPEGEERFRASHGSSMPEGLFNLSRYHETPFLYRCPETAVPAAVPAHGCKGEKNVF
jgi:hypothetical protein